LRYRFLTIKRECGEHFSSGWAVLESAAGKSTAHNYIVNKTIDEARIFK